MIAVPTTLLSNRPGYPTIRGRVLELERTEARETEEMRIVETAGLLAHPKHFDIIPVRR